MSRCLSCGLDCSPAARFCSQCGSPLTPGASGGVERRHLTVMFCDLVDSTELAERLDAEDLHEVVFRYQRTCAAVVARYEGHVAQYLGDGLLVYFGYPRAHEDDAERAARTAIDVLREIQSLNEELEGGFGVRIGVRMGIHSGPIVLGEVGDGESRERLALGETVNLASRLQHLAAPGTVLVSGATRRLVQGLFVFDDFAVRHLKGVTEPVETYRLVQPSGVRRRRSTAGDASPFVGRESELGLLLHTWEQVGSGRGHVVSLAGDAGMGKSRLVEAFGGELRERRHTWVECRCTLLGNKSPFAPVIEAIEQGLQFAPGDAPGERTRRLERALDAVGAPREQALPVLAPLFGLPVPADLTPLQLPAEAQRGLIFDVLTDWILTLARLQPLVLVVEDVQWIDPSSRDLFELLEERSASAAVMLLVTHRGAFPPDWRASVSRVSLELEPLGQAAARALVDALGAGRLADPVCEELVARGDGVPLFLEELTRDLLETGAAGASGPASPREIPATLQESMMARLDRLGPVREVVQLAATIGREFPQELLERVVSEEQAPLGPALETLVAAGLLERCASPSGASYTFRHGLVQEAAYESLLKSVRRRHHARIAEVLERSFPQRVASEPETLARHCQEAGYLERAVAYWRHAARRAMTRWATTEAVDRLEHALGLLSGLPCGPERSSLELDVLIDLGSARLATTGYATAEIREHYERTRRLAERTGESQKLVRPLISLAASSSLRGELPLASQLAQQAVELADGDTEPGPQLFARVVRSIPRFLAGDFALALADLEDATARHREEDSVALLQSFGQDPGVIARSWSGWVLWILGRDARALACVQDGLAMARASGHAPGVALAEVFVAIQHQLRGERDEVLAHCLEAEAIASRFGLVLFLGASQVLAAWATAAEEPEAARERLETGLRHIGATGGEALLPYFLSLGAEVDACGKRTQAALERLAAARECAASSGADFWRAELLRLEGELRSGQTPELGEADVCLAAACATARRQGAAGLERRLGAPPPRLEAVAEVGRAGLASA